MKTINSIGLIIIVLIQSNITSAQNSYEIGGIYSLMSEKLMPNNAEDIFNDKIFHSVGINSYITFNSRFLIKGGVHFQNFGTKIQIEETTIQMPEGTGDFFDVNWTGKSIDIPINLGIYILNRKKLRLGVAIGGNNRFIFSQSKELKGADLDTRIYKEYIFQFNTSIEIGIRLNDNFILNISPILQKQMNSNSNEYKQRGIGCQIGVSYCLGKN